MLLRMRKRQFQFLRHSSPYLLIWVNCLLYFIRIIPVTIARYKGGGVILGGQGRVNASVPFPFALLKEDERKRLFGVILFFCFVFRGLKPTATNIEPLRGSSGSVTTLTAFAPLPPFI